MGFNVFYLKTKYYKQGPGEHTSSSEGAIVFSVSYFTTLFALHHVDECYPAYLTNVTFWRLPLCLKIFHNTLLSYSETCFVATSAAAPVRSIKKDFF